MIAQIPRLRQLFESRLQQFTGILSADPPAELGNVETTMRSLKGFLFTLEGMVRKDDLRSMPFTVRETFTEQAREAVDMLERIGDVPSKGQILGVLRTLDCLHSLSIQVGLMTTGLDANRLGQITVILERRLSDTLGEIDGIAERARQRSGQIDQTAGDFLQQIEKDSADRLQRLAALGEGAVGHIEHQAADLRTRQGQVLAALEVLEREISGARQAHEQRLGDQLSHADELLDRTASQHKELAELLERTRRQLAAAEDAGGQMEDLCRSGNETATQLAGQLAEAGEVFRQLEKLGEGGARTASGLGERLSQAEAIHRRLSELDVQMQRLTAQADQRRQEADGKLSEAMDLLEQTRQRADEILQDARRQAGETLDAQRRQGEEVLDATRRQRDAADRVVETLQAVQAAAECAAQAAVDRRTAAEGHVEQIRQLQQAASQAARDTQERLESASASRQKLGQIEQDLGERAEAVRADQQSALEDLQRTIQRIEQVTARHDREMSEQLAAAQESLGAIENRQATSADALERTRQDADTVRQVADAVQQLRAAAEESGGQIAARLEGARQTAEHLATLHDQAGAMHQNLAEQARQAEGFRQRLAAAEQELQDVAVHARQRQSRLAEAMEELLNGARVRQGELGEVVDEQLATAQQHVAATSDSAGAAGSLRERTQEQLEAARTAAEAVARLAAQSAQADGEIRARMDAARQNVERLQALLAEGEQVGANLGEQAELAEGFRQRLAAAEQELQDVAVHARQRQSRLSEAMEELLSGARARQEELAGLLAEQTATAQQHVTAAGESSVAAASLCERTGEQLAGAKAAAQAIAALETETSRANKEIYARLECTGQTVVRLKELLDEGEGIRGRMGEQARLADAFRERLAAAEQELQDIAAHARQRQGRLSEAMEDLLAGARARDEELSGVLDEQVAAARERVASATASAEASGEQLAQASASTRATAAAQAQAARAEEDIRVRLDGAREVAERMEALLHDSDALRGRIAEQAQLAGDLQERLIALEEQAQETSHRCGQRQEQLTGAMEAVLEGARARQAELAELLAAQLHEAHGHVEATSQAAASTAELRVQAADQLAHASASAEAALAMESDCRRREAEIGSHLDAARQTVEHLEGLLVAGQSLGGRIEAEAQQAEESRRHLVATDEEMQEVAAAARERQSRLADDLEAVLAEARKRQAELAELLTERLAAAEKNVSATAASAATADSLREQSAERLAAAKSSAEAASEARLSCAQSDAEIRSRLQDARSGSKVLEALLAGATEARSRCEQSAQAAAETAERLSALGRQLDGSLEAARQQEARMEAARREVAAAVEGLGGRGQELLDEHHQRVAQVLEQSEGLHGRAEELLGSLTGEGIGQPFQQMAAEAGRARTTWFRLLLGGAGAGGLVVLGGLLVVLLGGGAGAVFLTIVGAGGLWATAGYAAWQVREHQQREAHYSHQAASGRALAPYRRLVSQLQDEGLADSPVVGQILREVFREPGRYVSEDAPLDAADEAQPADEDAVSVSE